MFLNFFGCGLDTRARGRRRAGALYRKLVALGTGLIGVVAAMLAMAAVLAGAAAQAGVPAQPHRGIYRLSLHDAATASGITDARGEMYYEWSASCEGWRVNQSFTLELLVEQGESQTVTLRYSAFEAADGGAFEFKLRQWADGRVLQRISGQADMNLPGGGGLVRLEEPAVSTLELPAGTMFPTRFVLASAASAAAGESVFSAPVFDGSSADSVYSVVSFFGVPEIVEAAPMGGRATLWPMQIAYFVLGDGGSEPAFEVSAEMFESGIARTFQMDYGNFAVLATLDEYQGLPLPDCAD